MLSRVYLPTRSLVTKGQHTLAGHWLFPLSSSFLFTGEDFSLSLCVSLFFLLSLSRLRGSPVFHINTQIPWHRLGPARVYTGTTAAFHDTRPLSPPPPLHLRLSAASPSFRPPYPPVSPPTLPRAAGEAHLRDSLPLAALKRPTPPSRPAPFPCPTRLRSGGQPPFPFPSGFSHLALRARRHRMLSQIARSFLTRVSAKGLLFLVLPCDLPPWVLCTSTSSSFYTVTVLCLFLLLFIPFPISFSTSFLLFVVYHFYLSLFSVTSLLRFVPCSSFPAYFFIFFTSTFCVLSLFFHFF